jgi:GTPase
MTLKKVAILGRPNVGKSTIFNKLCRSRRAIVADTPGITRDRIYGQVNWRGFRFEVIDTGGVVPGDSDLIRKLTLQQASAALEEADLVLFVVNVHEGLTALDEEVAGLLRRRSDQVLTVVNQVDHAKHDQLSATFYSLGMGEVFPISAEHSLGLDPLIEAIVERLGLESVEPEAPVEEVAEREIRVAIVGRPNVGKSTLLNFLVGQERAIVSEIPGTTRDSVDSLVQLNGRNFRFIDTAGIRRRGRTSKQIESLSVIMAQKSLKLADIALLLIDSIEGITKLDADIAGMAAEAGCSVLVLFNKWDQFKGDKAALDKTMAEMKRKMKFLHFAPTLTVSALTGYKTRGIYKLILNAFEARNLRVPTGRLNHQFLPRIREHLLNSGRFKALEVNFLTQAGIAPPTFVLFLSGKERLHFSLERYLENQLREFFGFYATPLRIVQRARGAGTKAKKQR